MNQYFVVDDAFLTSEEAARLLGISRASLYAYVSRGLLQSLATEPGRRRRLYRRDEVLHLRESRRRRWDPREAVESALSWGSPVLESAITLIGDGKLYYRGLEVSTLVEVNRFEEVVQLLWTGHPDGDLFAVDSHPRRLPAALRRLLLDLHPVVRMQVALPLAAADDLTAYDLRPPAIYRCGVRILRSCTLLAVLGSSGEARTRGDEAGVPAEARLARRLQAAWCPQTARGDEALDSILILCADHELNVSSFAARVVASARATPYDIVLAGLAALRGTRHGASSLRAEVFLRQLWEANKTEARGLRQFVGEQLRLGERVAGFGHTLYPEGDPRFRLIVERLAGVLGDSPVLAFGERLCSVMDELVGEPANLDLGLGLATLALGLPAGSSLTLFALGRIAGWIGHAGEQTQRTGLIRPRARYVGPAPRDAS